MDSDGGRIRHVTRIRNDGISLQQLGRGPEPYAGFLSGVPCQQVHVP